MQKVKFIKDFTRGQKDANGNRMVDKKGKIKTVTSRHAAYLEKNKFATLVGEKETEAPKGNE